MADDLDHAHLDPSGCAQVQLVPAPHFHALALGIRALPAAVRFAMGALIAALETRAIFATSSLSERTEQQPWQPPGQHTCRLEHWPERQNGPRL
jgi:hypothetical protein